MSVRYKINSPAAKGAEREPSTTPGSKLQNSLVEVALEEFHCLRSRDTAENADVARTPNEFFNFNHDCR